MASLWRIACHECRLAWRSGVLPLLAIVIASLLVAAAVVGWRAQASDNDQRARYQALVGAQWQSQPDRHPHRVAHYGFLLFRPRAPLSFFDTGVEAFTGTSLFLEPHRQNTANLSEARQSDGVLRFGQLTPALVLQLLVPLLIFVVGSGTVARERESGTLGLLVCQGQSYVAVLSGKLAGILATVAMLILPGLAIVTLWLGAAADDLWTLDIVVRAGLLGVAHAVYLIACSGLAVMISAQHRTARGALLTVVTLWLALWTVVPRLLPSVSVWLHPIPSRAALEAAVDRRIREIGDSHNPDDAKFAALRTDYLRRYGVSRLEDLPVNYNGVVMLEGERLTTDAYREHLARLAAVFARQERVIAWGGFVSPYLAMRNLSMALAGVDVRHGLEFERQAEDFRYRLMQRLNELHATEVQYVRDRYQGSTGSDAPTRQRISRAHWDELPAFDYRQPRVEWSAAGQTFAATALVAWLTGLAMVMRSIGRRAVLV